MILIYSLADFLSRESIKNKQTNGFVLGNNSRLFFDEKCSFFSSSSDHPFSDGLTLDETCTLQYPRILQPDHHKLGMRIKGCSNGFMKSVGQSLSNWVRFFLFIKTILSGSFLAVVILFQQFEFARRYWIEKFILPWNFREVLNGLWMLTRVLFHHFAGI